MNQKGFATFSLHERGFAHIFLILFLLAGLAVGVYLVQQKTNILPKAYEVLQPSSCQARLDYLLAIPSESCTEATNGFRFVDYSCSRVGAYLTMQNGRQKQGRIQRLGNEQTCLSIDDWVEKAKNSCLDICSSTEIVPSSTPEPSSTPPRAPTPPSAPPAPPNGLQSSCSESGSSAILSWNPPQGAENYSVIVTDTSIIPLDNTELPPPPTVFDTQLLSVIYSSVIPGHNYRWNVAACRGAGACSTSNYASFDCPASQ